MTDAAIDAARRVIVDAMRARIFPAATVAVGSSSAILWQEAFGSLTFDPDDGISTGPNIGPALLDTPFDLASLTKPLATTTVVMHLVDAGRLSLDERIETMVAAWRGADRASATVRDLLEHSAGLPARLPALLPGRLAAFLADGASGGRREFERDICAVELEYPPRTRSVYTDLGFILLGFLAEDRGERPLAEQFYDVVARVKPEPMGLTFVPPADARRRAAPTIPMGGDPRHGRLLQGEVHDNYAAALGGVAGHAGLFGSAGAVGAFARLVLRGARGDHGVPSPLSPALVARMTTKTSVPGSSRALGWDTMLPTSSCGTHMSASAFGHVGFTGTSLWIDPERDRYFVLLTNRVLGTGSLDDIRTVRRSFHDALSS